MGASSSSSEQQQRPHSAGTSVNRRANSLRRAEEMAQLEKERRAEEMAQRERERMAEEIAQLRMKRGPLFFPRPHLRRATGSIESFDSGVSLKSDRSKAEPSDFKDRVSLRPDFSSLEEEDVSDDDGVFESPDDLRTSATSTDSGVSISSVDRIINFSHRPDNSSSKEEHIVADDDDLIQCSDDLVLPKCTASTESGSVYIQSDGSQGCTEHFEDTPSPSTKRKNSLKNVFKNLFKINPSREDKWQI